MQDSGPKTTAMSQEEGRMKVGAGCMHGSSKKCLKCAMKKHMDGRGGPGIVNNPLTTQQSAMMARLGVATSPTSSALPGGVAPAAPTKAKKFTLKGSSALKQKKKAVLKSTIAKSKSVKPRKLPKMPTRKIKLPKSKRRPVF